MPELPGCRFLDLFAGSGGIGIEALSRGADYCCFVDSSRNAAGVIRKNLAFTKLAEQADVLQMDAVSAVSVCEGKEAFDLVFLDPPYGQGLELEVLRRLAGSACIHQNTLLVLETALHYDSAPVQEAGFTILREKHYKTNQHLFLKRSVQHL